MRNTTQPTPLSLGAPGTITNPQVASAGVATSALRSDAKFGIPNPATPATLTFAGSSANGAGTGFAPDTHVHGVPDTWHLVASGNLGAVSSLDVPGLTGFKHYRLELFGQTAAQVIGNVTATINGLTAANYGHQFQKVANGAATAAGTAGNANWPLATSLSGGTVNVMALILEVFHDDQASSPVGCLWHLAQIAAAAISSGQTVGGGIYNANVATITEITVAWSGGIDGGNYRVWGCN